MGQPRSQSWISGLRRAAQVWVWACCIAPGGVSLARAGGLVVERGPGAEHCPDTAALADALALQRGELGGAPDADLVVRFHADGAGLRARIARQSAPDAERVITSSDRDCSGLARAAVVALALLEAATSVAPPEAPPPEAPPLAAPPASAPQPPPEPRRDAPPSLAPGLHSGLVLSVGAGAVMGVTRLAAPVLDGELGLVRGPVRITMGGLLVPTHRDPLGPGSLRTWLLAAKAAACIAPWRAPHLRLDACTGLWAGQIDVRARGYTQNDQQKQPWLALPLLLTLSGGRAALGFELVAGALVELRRPDFRVEGAGYAYRSWPVAAWVAAHFTLRSPTARQKN